MESKQRRLYFNLHHVMIILPLLFNLKFLVADESTGGAETNTRLPGLQT